MSMKRILGTMLATRMAGRGRSKGALGTASALGLLGSRRRVRRGGMGSKLGLAALGYMAYQAYQSHQSSQGTASRGTGGSASQGSSGGGLFDKVRDAANEFLGGPASQSPSPASAASGAHGGGVDDEDVRAGEAAAERFSEDEALLMIRAMITAAYADGSLSQEERGRIVQAINDADATPDERAMMEREIANPRPLDELLTQVGDEETAEEFYLASRAAIDGDSEGDRRYLQTLRDRLNLSAEQAEEADAIAS
ncbi:tellurite resistance TerB family protein [Roseivivax isoporae]|uniref:Protein YebE n=1 Tax=Roseivivax isoporae LMG 25204 TaxID=1449351 RepID=X7FDC4_9RHOB|nr:DUF533 domain-containing protein [Roseivivax isoporae]ETX30820.1 hypothetical protein RISW2_00110 [Roseivivax isoporae LMG 25204]